MKVHRIVVDNLNSLYGRHEVDLETALDGASLFLIHGPTGAGKSTLMDAVSLALFGETPRLDASRGDATADPRAIMSRGMGECSAELVFSKLDGGARRYYRAKWTARRARSRGDGKLQPAERSLEEKVGEDWKILASDHRHKVYGPAFKEVLEGFSVQDFNRSMLLAQGQFDAFLRAGTDERARILERLTDTAIYQEIGARAARMRSAHEDTLKRLRQQIDGGGGLAPEALQELETEHQANTQELTEVKERSSEVSDHLKWFDESVAHKRALEEAATTRVELNAEVKEFEPNLTRLAQHDGCAAVGAFGKFDAHAETLRRQQEGLAELTRLAEELPKLKSAVEEDTKRVQSSAESESLASAHLEGIRLPVAAAEEARLALEQAILQTNTGLERCREAEARVEESRGALKLAVEAQGVGEERVKSAQAALEGKVVDGSLAEAWEQLRPTLDELASMAWNLRKGMERIKASTDNIDSEAGLLEEAERAHTLASEPLKGPRGQLAVCQQMLREILSGADFDDLRAQRTALIADGRKKREANLAALAPVQAAFKGQQQVQEAQAKAQATGLKVVDAEAVVERCSVALAHKAEVFALAQGALERASRVASLLEHRQALVDGQECPLCGAEEHPYSKSDTDVDAVDQEISDALSASEHAQALAQKERDIADHAHREAMGDFRELSVARKLHDEQVGSAQAEQVLLDASAKEALSSSGLPLESTSADVDVALKARSLELKEAGDALAVLEEAWRAQLSAEKTLRGQEQAYSLQTTALAERRVALSTKRELNQNTGRDQQALQARYDVGVHEQRAGLEGLGLVFGEAFPEQPAHWRKLIQERVDAHRERLQTLSRSTANAATLGAQVQGQERMLAERIAHSQKQASEQRVAVEDQGAKDKQAQGTLSALQERWRSAPSGHGREPHEAALSEAPLSDKSVPRDLLESHRRWHQLTEASAKSAAVSHQASELALTSAASKHETLSEAQVVLDQETEAAGTLLKNCLKALGLPTDSALIALRLKGPEHVALKDKKAELDHRATSIGTLLAERRLRADDHKSNRPATLGPEVDREALAVALESVRTHLQKVTETHRQSMLGLELHHNAERELKLHRALFDGATKQAAVWQRLHQLIGVRDGEKFKEFAQAMNLGQLLDKANVHLSRLSDRYQLIPRLDEGLPTLDFDLSDGWQIGHRISPRSLSGGERFLVSLSLALGLSDFRAVKMPIETLLLDEGFGTLDLDTLSVALGALSQLQADGRQVGIISHVIGLREQIPARIEVRPLGGGRSEVKAGA